jgi:glycosyltransferase involved in cell wall biosynthesis
METQQLRLSAIIPTHNRCKELRRTLESLKTQTLPPEDYEIIVVDNGSEDATYDVVEALNHVLIEGQRS